MFTSNQTIICGGDYEGPGHCFIPTCRAPLTEASPYTCDACGEEQHRLLQCAGCEHGGVYTSNHNDIPIVDMLSDSTIVFCSPACQSAYFTERLDQLPERIEADGEAVACKAPMMNKWAEQRDYTTMSKWLIGHGVPTPGSITEPGAWQLHMRAAANDYAVLMLKLYTDECRLLLEQAHDGVILSPSDARGNQLCYMILNNVDSDIVEVRALESIVCESTRIGSDIVNAVLAVSDYTVHGVSIADIEFVVAEKPARTAAAPKTKRSRKCGDDDDDDSDDANDRSEKVPKPRNRIEQKRGAIEAAAELMGMTNDRDITKLSVGSDTLRPGQEDCKMHVEINGENYILFRIEDNAIPDYVAAGVTVFKSHPFFTIKKQIRAGKGGRLVCIQLSTDAAPYMAMSQAQLVESIRAPTFEEAMAAPTASATVVPPPPAMAAPILSSDEPPAFFAPMPVPDFGSCGSGGGGGGGVLDFSDLSPMPMSV